MGKRVTLSDEAYAALLAQKKGKVDSLSQIVLRFVPPPIQTFGDLEKHLQNLDGPVNVAFEALRRVRRRKQEANLSGQ